MTDYRLEIDGWAYKPLPESWLDHPRAVDHDQDAGPNAVRLFATSAAINDDGTRLQVRYLDPFGDGVLERTTPAAPADRDAGRIPRALAEDTGALWARSYVPQRGIEPDDTHRAEEWDHFLRLWMERSVLSEKAANAGLTIADGGGR